MTVMYKNSGFLFSALRCGACMFVLFVCFCYIFVLICLRMFDFDLFLFYFLFFVFICFVFFYLVVFEGNVLAVNDVCLNNLKMDCFKFL